MKMNYNFKTLFANKSEPKDLEIFFRCLTLRATEIIVQSRLGEKVSTPCKLHPCAPDWFNLNVSDLPEVVYEAKKVLNIDLLITRKFPFCVEISLRTAEGDNMILETWCIRIINEPIDSNVTCSHLYGVMGLLLKSLISVTRVTPAYKLSRRQGPDSYVICYRMYMDEPTHHSLGEGYKDVRFGQIITPVGAFQLTCAYRTKMTISPTQNSRESSILMLKSDHFNTNNLSPNNRRRYNENDSHTSSLSETMKIGAFAERKKKHFDELQLDLPFCTFFADKISLNAEPMENNAPSTESSLDDDDDDDDADEDLRRTSSLENNERLKQKIEDSTVDDDDESFSSAQQQRNNNEKNGNISNQIIESSTTATTTTTTLSTGDDFIMVDLKTPFAKPSGEKVELTKFFREWQQAPLLETFKEMPPVEATDLQRQLETFESDLNEFDNIVQTLCQSSPNNN